MAQFTVVNVGMGKGNLDNDENIKRVKVDTFPDRVVRERAAKKAAKKSTFTDTEVAVFFGSDGKVSSETYITSFEVSKDGVVYE